MDDCIARSQTFVLALAMMLLTSSLARAANGQAVFYFDDTGRATVRLDRVSPISEGLKAILAMYALQNGTGCSGNWDDLDCALTEALRLGTQCSKQHLALVSKWFKSGIPKMSKFSPAIYRDVTSENLKSICYSQSTGATFQKEWDMIRVEKSGNRVLVYAHGVWSAREDSGQFSYLSEYEIGRDAVAIISHREKHPEDRK